MYAKPSMSKRNQLWLLCLGKIHFLACKLSPFHWADHQADAEGQLKEAHPLSRDAASCTSLHTATWDNAVFKAGLNKLLCSASQGTRRVQPGAVSLKSGFKLHLKQLSGCIHRFTMQENRLGSQWHCAQSSQGIPPPTVCSYNSDLVTTEEGTSKVGMCTCLQVGKGSALTASKP